MPSCSVLYCFNTAQKGYRLFCFPKDEQRNNKWVKFCKRKNWNASCNSRICECHFEDTHFQNRPDKVKKLKSDALPTIFKPVSSVKRTHTILETSTSESEYADSDDMSTVTPEKIRKCEQNNSSGILSEEIDHSQRSSFQGAFERFLTGSDGNLKEKECP